MLFVGSLNDILNMSLIVNLSNLIVESIGLFSALVTLKIFLKLWKICHIMMVRNQFGVIVEYLASIKESHELKKLEEEEIKPYWFISCQELSLHELD